MLKINTYNCFQTLESRLDWPHDSVSQQLCGMLRIVKKKKKKYNTKFKIIKYIYNKFTTLLLVKNYNGVINKIHCLQNNNKIAFI